MSALFEDIQPLSLSAHREQAVLLNRDYRFALAQNVAAIATREFAMAAPHMPILFARRGEGVSPVVVLGLVEGQNALVSDGGEWQGGYIPAALRLHPFAIVRVAGGDGRAMLGVTGRALVAAGTEGSLPIVGADGKLSPEIENTQKFAADVGRAAALTQTFCQRLQSLDLLAPLRIQARAQGGRVFNVNGFLTISRERLAALDPGTLHALMQEGFLEAVWLQLLSLRQLRNLAERSGSALDDAARDEAGDTDEPGQISFRRSTWSGRLS